MMLKVLESIIPFRLKKQHYNYLITFKKNAPESVDWCMVYCFIKTMLMAGTSTQIMTAVSTRRRIIFQSEMVSLISSSF